MTKIKKKKERKWTNNEKKKNIKIIIKKTFFAGIDEFVSTFIYNYIANL